MTEIVNLPTLKAEAEKAKESQSELEIWQMEISPDVVLRLVKIAEEAHGVVFAATAPALRDLKKAMKGVKYE